MFCKDGVGKTGSGVLIAVYKTYVSSEVKTENNNNNHELISIRIQLKDKKYLIVGSFYRPDWTDDEYMENFTETVEGIRTQCSDQKCG